jgi:hypothetical protein
MSSIFGGSLGALGGGGAIGRSVVQLQLDSAAYNAELAQAEGKTAESTSAMEASTAKAGAGMATAFAGAAVGAALFEKASVEADIDAWLPFLEPGGFLVLHDSTDLSSYPGPAEVALARLRVGPIFDAVGSLGGTTWARRAGAVSPWSPTVRGAGILDTAIRVAKSLRKRRSPS